jgi:putative flippase GtrA
LEGNILLSRASEGLWLVARFLVVGALNSLIGVIVIFLCMALLQMPPLAANAMGYGVGFLVSFFLHRHYTFRSRVKIGAGLATYFAVVACAYAANAAVLLVMTSVLQLNAYLSQIVSIGAYSTIIFLTGRRYVFNHARR